MQSEKAAITTIAELVIPHPTKSGEMQIEIRHWQHRLLIVRQTGRNAMQQVKHGKKQILKRSRLGASVTAKKRLHICKTSASDTELAKPTEHPLGLQNLTGSKYNAGIKLLPCITEKVLSDGMLTTSFRFTGKRFPDFTFQTICESSNLTKTNERQTNMLWNNIITALTARVAALEGTQP